MISVPRLRYWFAAATVLVVAVVAGFYVYARYRIFRHVKIPQNISVDVQQSTNTFSLSKSEGGRTLFTIRASRAVQYKQGGRAALHNVNIVVYGRESNRFDQIYGDEFDYDPQTGEVVAKGVVHIDLEANPVPDAHPELKLPRELKNPIHLKTSGLVFNQKTGLAKTDELIEFEVPQANGSAKGAYYDSKANTLTLGSNITVNTTGPDATRIVAQHGVITQDPRRAVLDRVELDRSEDTMTANKATLFLRQDNSLERVLAEGNVRTAAKGETGLTTEAPRAEFFVSGKNQIKSAVMSGGVTFATTGANLVAGNAGRLVADFGPEAKVQVVHASEGVVLIQRPSSTSSASLSQPKLVRAKAGAKPSTAGAKDEVELKAQAMDFFVKGGRVLDHAETLGSGQITITPQSPQQQQKNAASGPTVVTAGKFTAGFSNNRLSGLHAAPQAKIVQSTPGQPDKVSTSDALDATFDKAGSIAGFIQQGNFQYREGQFGDKVSRSASADKATYSTVNQVLTLEGSPRVVDGTMATTAQFIRLNRASGDAEAQNNVKTTYSALSSQSNGALLTSGDPVHVTAAKMNFSRATGVARYVGNARLWQGANIVEAQSIDFNRDKRSMDAQGNATKRVAVVLVQSDKKGSQTPVNVSSTRLLYTDQQRVAHFEGGVVIRSADGTVTADRVDAYLKARQDRTNKTAAVSSGPSELERINADGHIVLQQPNRRGTGEKLVYTADDGKFVLTGGPPTIIDAQQGTVTGASLTFYSRDDKVLVEGGGNSRAVTTTRVSK